MISFEKGDIFATPAMGKAHGCNLAGAMGAGIAVQFRQNFPRMFHEYRLRVLRGMYQLGDVFAWKEGNQTVYNLMTQAHWKTAATLPAIRASVGTMLKHAEIYRVPEILIPRVGAGLGALDWQDVKEVLIELAEDSPISLRVCEDYEPKQVMRKK